jgi:hypothetical protein
MIHQQVYSTSNVAVLLSWPEIHRRHLRQHHIIRVKGIHVRHNLPNRVLPQVCHHRKIPGHFFNYQRSSQEIESIQPGVEVLSPRPPPFTGPSPRHTPAYINDMPQPKWI